MNWHFNFNLKYESCIGAGLILESFGLSLEYGVIFDR
jgi:hypothetical protein